MSPKVALVFSQSHFEHYQVHKKNCKKLHEFDMSVRAAEDNQNEGFNDIRAFVGVLGSVRGDKVENEDGIQTKKCYRVHKNRRDIIVEDGDDKKNFHFDAVSKTRNDLTYVVSPRDEEAISLDLLHHGKSANP